MRSKLILLHGAMGSSEQMLPVIEKLNDEFEIHNLELPGHGSSRSEVHFDLENFAGFVIRYMDKHNMDRASFFGYSMGGYIGLYIAAKFPGKIEKLITLGTKLSWSKEIAENEIKMLDPETIESKLPAFAQQLDERHHAENWKWLMIKTAGLMLGLGNESGLIDFEKIEIPVLLMLGDRDKMVGFEETQEVYKKLKLGSLAVLPGHPHPIERSAPSTIAFFIRQFMK